MTRFDETHLRRLLSGDTGLWGLFVDSYAAVIYAAVRRRLTLAGRDGDVEDVAQDVFVRLCKNDLRLLRTFDSNRAKLSTWLTVVSTSTAIDHLRRQKTPTEDIETQPESVLAVDPTEPVRLQIPAGLLSERQALVLELLYRREMDVKEVSELLSIDPQTVRSTHHKALTKLREHFREDERSPEG